MVITAMLTFIIMLNRSSPFYVRANQNVMNCTAVGSPPMANMSPTHESDRCPAFIRSRPFFARSPLLSQDNCGHTGSIIVLRSHSYKESVEMGCLKKLYKTNRKHSEGKVSHKTHWTASLHNHTKKSAEVGQVCKQDAIPKISSDRDLYVTWLQQMFLSAMLDQDHRTSY